MAGHKKLKSDFDDSDQLGHQFFSRYELFPPPKVRGDILVSVRIPLESASVSASASA